MTLFDPHEWQLRIDTLESELRNVYRERAHLVAHLASLYRSHLGDTDQTTAPDWPVVTVETPTGQMAWHVHAGDTDLFHPLVKSSEPIPYDGHSTEQKYFRLRQLTQANHDGPGAPTPAAAAVPDPQDDDTDPAPADTATPDPAPADPADTDDDGKAAA